MSSKKYLTTRLFILTHLRLSLFFVSRMEVSRVSMLTGYLDINMILYHP